MGANNDFSRLRFFSLQRQDQITATHVGFCICFGFPFYRNFYIFLQQFFDPTVVALIHNEMWQLAVAFHKCLRNQPSRRPSGNICYDFVVVIDRIAIPVVHIPNNVVADILEFAFEPAVSAAQKQIGLQFGFFRACHFQPWGFVGSPAFKREFKLVCVRRDLFKFLEQQFLSFFFFRCTNWFDSAINKFFP